MLCISLIVISIAPSGVLVTIIIVIILTSSSIWCLCVLGMELLHGILYVAQVASVLVVCN